jgi:hypothetical protein
MKESDCREWIDELVECARRGAVPSARLSAHLWDCRRCAEQWSAQRSLSGAMLDLRLALAAEQSPESRRRQLMAEFDRLHRLQSHAWLRWAWVAAAALLLAVGVVQLWRTLPGRTAVPPPPSIASATLIEEDEESGFVPVPYTLPLAPGESVRIVRRDLNGAELARMGFELPGVYGNDLEADVMLGEDGIPRAVHLIESEQF